RLSAQRIRRITAEHTVQEHRVTTTVAPATHRDRYLRGTFPLALEPQCALPGTYLGARDGSGALLAGARIDLRFGGGPMRALADVEFDPSTRPVQGDAVPLPRCVGMEAVCQRRSTAVADQHVHRVLDGDA